MKLNEQKRIRCETNCFTSWCTCWSRSRRGIEKIIEGLNEVITKDENVQIALETMAGKGTEIGRTFDELAKIIDGVTHNEKLSVCLDTCHIHDAGYDVVERL